MKKNLVRMIIGIFVILTFCSITSNALATEFEMAQYNEKYEEWLNLPEQEREKTIPPAMFVKKAEKAIDTFSIKYNARLMSSDSKTDKYSLLENISLKVKNQEETGQCWAFSITTQLESYMQIIKSQKVEYSPRHIEYSTAKTFLDGINPLGFDREVNSGGNALLAYAYMIRGQGPVLEKDMPFVNTKEKINLSDIEGKTVQAQLEEFITFPSIYKEVNNGITTYTNGQDGNNRVEYTKAEVTSIRNKVKEHIMKYGSVTAPTLTGGKQYFSDTDVYISSKAYYCYDETAKADHQISIIGWDDNYAVSNFNKNHQPSSPGAWLVQNSYGTEIEIGDNTFPVHENGLLYISYEDCLIETLMTGIISLDEVDYDNVYQHDVLGLSGAIQGNGNEIYTANVFEKDYKTTYINEIGFYTVPDHSYEIFVNATDDKLTGDNFIKVKTVAETESDYITVELDKPIKLTGKKFAVAIKYITEEIAMAPVECQLTLDINNRYYNTATSKAGESYASMDATTWFDCSELNIMGMKNINACIKAFTVDTIEQPVEITLKSNAYTVKKQDKVITKVLPNTNVVKFKSNLITEGTIELYDKDNIKLVETQTIKTGDILKLVETNDTYIISVTGDISGDGKITATDLVKLKKDLVNIKKLTGEYKSSADLDNNGKLSSTDMLKIKQIICKIITL